MTIALVLCWFVSLFGGTSDVELYTQYHQDVIKAESLIAVGQYDKASKVYQNLIDQYDFVFLREFKVAAQLALHAGDRPLAVDLLRLAIAGGWTLQQIRKNDYLLGELETSDWRMLKEEYHSLRNRFESSLNIVVREEVLLMFKKDQRKAMRALFVLGSKARDRHGEKRFAPHSEQQVEQLKKIMAEHGYPGERLIGNGLWMSTILSHHNSISAEYNRNDALYPALKPALIQAISKGQMSPYDYAIIEDWYVAVSSDRSKSAFGYLTTLSEEDLPRSDSLRRDLGMRSVELRNRLVEVEQLTGMDLYLEGKPWVEGKIHPFKSE